MHSVRLKNALPNVAQSLRLRLRPRLRRRDGLRLALALAALAVVLSTTSFYVRQIPSAAAIAAEARAAAEQAEKYARMRRTGSIVFANNRRLCEEVLFDNVANRLLSVQLVDCEERLIRADPEDAQVEKTARMRGVLSSFKR